MWWSCHYLPITLRVPYQHTRVWIDSFLVLFFFVVISRRLNFVCRRFGTLCSIFIRGVSRKNNGDEIFSTYTLYADETECSETSAYKIQTPGNYPKERIQHSEHGESLKSRFFSLLPPWGFEILKTFVKLIDLYFYKFLSCMRRLLFVCWAKLLVLSW
jgi:hypothetical protein